MYNAINAYRHVSGSGPRALQAPRLQFSIFQTTTHIDWFWNIPPKLLLWDSSKFLFFQLYPCIPRSSDFFPTLAPYPPPPPPRLPLEWAGPQGRRGLELYSALNTKLERILEIQMLSNNTKLEKQMLRNKIYLLNAKSAGGTLETQ